ncbi:uncharacterized protein LOC106716161 [Papilio machaon]|uniref:uncharacterized protein LOC106716161 n=1 Tax=Papilio machaon TaxID=76193 RepID=UPI001E663423|nr:uncharacterized protein LOC106716161 [Papilio machaon]
MYMYFQLKIFIHVVFVISSLLIESIHSAISCRDRSVHLRLDGGLCFEIPPWQYLPVEMDHHIAKVKEVWGNLSSVRDTRRFSLSITNSKISQYVDTVIGPFLDTYHKNIQTSYQQMTNKILRKTKEEINAAIRIKHKVYEDLIKMADRLAVPAMCDEERRYARTIASRHVAQIYKCTEEARNSITKMGKYAEEMITITRNHMQAALANATSKFDVNQQYKRESDKINHSVCLKELSKAAVSLGYELDLSLTNARRYNEQSCERFTVCCTRARKDTEESTAALKDYLYQCVYA